MLPRGGPLDSTDIGADMIDPKSTNDVRMIALETTRQQSEVCAAKCENLEDKLRALERATASNAASITSLTTSVATMATNVAILKGRPGVWAFIGGAIPGLLTVLLWWFSR